MIKVTKISPLENYKLKLVFSDGTAGIYDLAQFVARTGPMIAPLREPDFFKRVFLEGGAPTWPNGYDIAPWALHKELQDAGILKPADAHAAE